MAFAHALNGLSVFLADRENALVEAISERFKLDVDKVRAVIDGVDKGMPKSIKTRKTAPKGGSKGSSGPKVSKTSGFILFSNENRPKVSERLVTDKSYRKYKDKDGKTQIVDKADFSKEGKPKFGDITKRIGAEWRDMTEKQQQKWKDKANDINAENAAEGKKSPKKSTKKSKEVVIDSEEEEEFVASESEEEAPPPPPKKTKKSTKKSKKK